MKEGGGTTRVFQTVKSGITFGSALAMVISYVNWHSVLWAIFTACSAGCVRYLLYATVLRGMGI